MRPIWNVIEGDARVVLPDLAADIDAARTVVITDPIWPNAPSGMFEEPDAWRLFADVAALVATMARRLIVHLGYSSDPRFLFGVPPSLPFVRTCWLRYARPGQHGTLLASGDVAYVFGTLEHPHERTLLPGEVTSRHTDGKLQGGGAPLSAEGRARGVAGGLLHAAGRPRPRPVLRFGDDGGSLHSAWTAVSGDREVSGVCGSRSRASYGRSERLDADGPSARSDGAISGQAA